MLIMSGLVTKHLLLWFQLEDTSNVSKPKDTNEPAVSQLGAGIQVGFTNVPHLICIPFYKHTPPVDER